MRTAPLPATMATFTGSTAGSRFRSERFSPDLELGAGRRGPSPPFFGASDAERHVYYGSWLCENARALGGDSRSYSFKAVLAVKLASAFDLENKIMNVILAVFRSFAFLHSQGRTLTAAEPGRVKKPMSAKRQAWRRPA